jgi:hypothetical protein
MDNANVPSLMMVAFDPGHGPLHVRCGDATLPRPVALL